MISLLGFFIFISIFSQLISGTMLSFSLLPDSMLIPMSRGEEDLENLYTDDFFWLHERGVDLLFIFSYFHFLRKLFIKAYNYENESAWKSGVFSLLILQVVVFAGLVLCCTHLSEITLTIAVNIMHTFFLFYGKFYWWIFTDKQLNCDTLIRLAYLHYLSAFYLTYISITHSIDMHYDWKNDSNFSGYQTELAWVDEVLLNELGCFCSVLVVLYFICFILYEVPESLSYELFMWGDVGMSTDIRFFGVAPHWYFRPLMAWLIVCPFHKTGVFGILFFFLIIFYQPNLHGFYLFFKKIYLILTKFFNKTKHYYKSNPVDCVFDYKTGFVYFLFFFACMYTTSFLPYGRFYHRLGGNFGMFFSYMFVFSFLAFNGIRNINILSVYFNRVLNLSKAIIKIGF